MVICQWSFGAAPGMLRINTDREGARFCEERAAPLDQRTLGMGTLDGEHWLASLRALEEISPDLAVEVRGARGGRLRSPPCRSMPRI